MAIITATVGKIMIGAADLGEVNNGALAIVIDSAESTELGDTWKTNIALGKSWTLNASLLYDPTNPAQLTLRTEFTAGDGVLASVSMYEDAAEYFEGAAIITGFNVTKAINAPDAVAITLVGNGILNHS